MRVMLDTNLWSYLADDRSLDQFDRMLSVRKLTLCVAPSTLLEVVAIPHEDVRRRIIRGMATGPRRTRMHTEADSQASEVVALIRRTHPEWMHQIPNPAAVARLRTWWLKRLWREALTDSTRIHEYQRGQLPVRDLILKRQRDNRKEILRTKFTMGPLMEITGSAEDPVGAGLPGWDGKEAQLWRLNLAQLTWFQLGVAGPRAGITGEDRTMTDWVEPYVKLARARSDPSSFVAMWLDEARIEEVPRNWLHWAVEAVQWTRKIGSGNPADAQHASYLIDCDLFLSADAGLIRTLQDVRRDAPFSFATPLLVSGDSDVPASERIAAALR